MSEERFCGCQNNDQICGNKCGNNMVNPMNAKCECKYDMKMPVMPMMPMMENKCGCQNSNMIQGIGIIRE